MAESVRQVRGDARTDELAAMNAIDIPPQPDEIAEWSANHPIYIFNVCPEVFTIEHPLVGKLIIPACPEGEPYSQPVIVQGMIPYGVRVEMKTAELRHESGRHFVCDILGVGPFKDPRNSLLRHGVFIAASDTFDPEDRVTIRQGKITISLPRWVDTRSGKCAKVPTDSEVARANEMLAQWDFAKIAEADQYHDNGPHDLVKGSGNITREHRLALRRRGQVREWDKPTETLTACPGCGVKVPPTMIVHTACGYVFDWEKAVDAGMKRAEDRPQPKTKEAKGR